MPYHYRDDLTSADMAFDAWGDSPEELLRASVDATVQLMIDDLKCLRRSVRKKLRLETQEKDEVSALRLLLHELLQKIVFYKDAEELLLRVERVHLAENPWALELELSGEKIDPSRHPLGTDVKAATYHQYQVTRTMDGWRATVVLDT